MSALSERQKEALTNAFDDIDVARSGSIKKSDLRATLQLIGQNPTSEEMTVYMGDIESEGQFTRDEFVKFIEEHVPLKTEEEIKNELTEAFEKFDEDRNQSISREMFRKVMTKMGDEPLSQQDADALLESLDTIETDGVLSYKELATLFMG